MVNSVRKKEIIEIPSTIQPKTVKIRVAGYARVSSDSEDQLNSFASQVSYYTSLIGENSQWELAEIYADEGISGISTTKRVEFNRMIEDCKEGEIDRIITKSVSRFARNTLDSITILRVLKQWGVTVFFEKEGIDTSKISSENLITLYASFAQHESHAISQNCKKGVRMRMEKGVYIATNAPYGYRLEDKILVICEFEADVVRQIFSDYLSGKGVTQIANALVKQGIPRKDGGHSWNATAVSYILKNEKYKGDSLWQKKFNEDVLPYTAKVNRGELPQYYVKNTHSPIISDIQFELANILLSKQREKINVLHKEYPLSKKIKCKQCGTTYTRKVTRGKIYWVCKFHHQNKENCPSPRIREDAIYHAFVILYNKLRGNYQEILVPMVSQLEKLQEMEQKDNQQLKIINQKLVDIAKQNQTMSGLMASGILDSALFVAKTDELKQEMDKVKLEKSRLLNKTKHDDTKEKTEELVDVLEHGPEFIQEFHPELFHELVEKILAQDGETLEFQLKNGLILTERM